MAHYSDYLEKEYPTVITTDSKVWDIFLEMRKIGNYVKSNIASIFYSYSPKQDYTVEIKFTHIEGMSIRFNLYKNLYEPVISNFSIKLDDSETHFHVDKSYYEDLKEIVLKVSSYVYDNHINEYADKNSILDKRILEIKKILNI